VRVVVLPEDSDHFPGGHDLGRPDEKADRTQRPRRMTCVASSRESLMNKALRWRELPVLLHPLGHVAAAGQGAAVREPGFRMLS
jgi:hypothetical protein